MKPSRDISGLLAVMAALRTPKTGCPWDLQQDFASVVLYTIEEAYEVADAIERADMLDLKDELGDLLLQVVFHSRMAEEQGAFAFADVVEAINAKMIRRHPHVFGEVRDLPTDVVNRIWEDVKAQEKLARAAERLASGMPPQGQTGLLSDVPTTLPAMTRAMKLQQKASTVGFDWNDARIVLDKIREEIGEIDEAMADGTPAKIKDEIGDLLFAVVNLARHTGVDPEAALRGTNEKFVRRFRHIESTLSTRGVSLNDASLDEMDALWNDAKRFDKTSG